MDLFRIKYRCNEIRKMISFLPFILLFLSCTQSPKTIKIGDYSFVTPDWWNEVNVELNNDINTDDEIRKFVTEKYGADVGIADTWKESLKVWAIYSERTNGFPIYIAHCYRTGGMYEDAILVYKDLYYLADKQDKKDWYKCFLPYLIGEAYESLNDDQKAVLWYSYGTKSNFITSDSPSIRYYAEESKSKVFELDPNNATDLIINAQ